MKKFTFFFCMLLLSGCIMAQSSGNIAATPPVTIVLDKADYLPGEIANILGKGFQPFETVDLQVLHADGTPQTGSDHEPWTISVAANGEFTTSWHVCEDDCLGSILQITAQGRSSGLIAKANFSDAASFVFVGSFKVGDGPCWNSPTPPTYTAREAAALLFGGSPNDYAISVNTNTSDETTITHTAYVDGYGNTTYLNSPASEDFKQGTMYTYPSFSAYVKDHSDGSNDLARITCNYTGYPIYVNYVWRKVTQTITTSLTSVSFCANQNVSVNYAATGTFNAANIFTAQLSDASGSFSSPTIIGSVNATTSGVINGIVPVDGTPGTAYRIRVVSNDPAVTGSDNGSNITIKAQPSVICPDNITVVASPGQCGTNVSFNGAGVGTISYSPASGSFFPVGSTMVTITATTDCGSSSCTFTVTVIDNEAPVISCPANIVLNATTGQCSATVNYSVTATDNCSGQSATATSLSGDVTNTDFNNATSSVFSSIVQANKLTFTTNGYAHSHGSPLDVYVDVHNPVSNTWTQVFTQNIVGGGQFNFSDLTITFASQPADQIRLRSSTGQNQTFHNWSASTFKLSNLTSVITTPISGSTLNVGVATVTSIATDGAGNISTCSFTVTVVDNQAPNIACPIIGNTNRNTNAGVCTYTTVLTEFNATATDNCTVTSLTYTLTGVTTGTGTSLAGVVFNKGITTVTWTARDGAAATVTCGFTVTVVDNEPPMITCPGNITVNNDPGVCGAIVNYGTNEFYCTNNSGTSLVKINTSTGAVINIGPFGFGGTWALGFKPDGTAWTTVNWGQLASVNLTTGAATPIGAPFSFTAICLDANSSGQLYTIGWDANLYTVNTTTGALTFIANTGLSSVMDIAFDASNKLWAINSSGKLYSINTTTGLATLESSLSGGISLGDEMGLAISTSGTFYMTEWTSSPRLFSVNPVTGVTTLINALAASYPHGGDFSPLGGGATATDNCGTPTVTYSIVSGSVFPKGTTTVTATATDASGNTATCSFTVTVADNQQPVITCPVTGNTNRNTNAGLCTYSAVLTEFNATASDNCAVTSLTYTLTGVTTGTGTTLAGVVLNKGVTTVTWTASDGVTTNATCSFTVTVVDNEKPVITTCASNKTSASDAGLCTKTFTSVEIGSPTATDNCSYTLNWSRSDAAPNLADPFPFGITTIKWTAIDGAGLTATCNQTINIDKITTTTSVTVTPSTKQYSDKVTLTATVTPCGCGSLPAIGGLVTFKVGTQTMGTASIVCGVNGIGTATLSNVALLEPVPFGTAPIGQMAPGIKTVTASYNGADAYLASNSTATNNLTITCEDARAYYTGACYASTSSPTNSNATVTLSATIKDITAISGDPDSDAGDIRNAKVRFVNRDLLVTDPNYYISGWLNVGLVNTADTKTGTVTYNWNTTISGDAQSYTIGIIVNNYYCRNMSDDDAIVTVAKPLGDLFITGGGYLALTNSAGIKAGTAGTKNNFGFNVKYNKAKTNLQGNINTIIRRLETDGMHVYQVKGNVMTSLVVSTACPKTAIFNGKANIQDITNPLLPPVPVDGNATLQVRMTDLGEPGSSDKIAITVWNKDGGLWFASNWNGTTTIEQVLGGGNLKVHGGGECITSPLTNQTIDNRSMEVTAEPTFFNVKAYPNPSEHQFTLIINSNLNEAIVIQVYDVTGRKIQTLNGRVNENIRFGEKLKAGIYFAQVRQGNKLETVKLIKQ